MHQPQNKGHRTARRVVIAVTGTMLVVIGIALTVLPGPATVVIPAGIGVRPGPPAPEKGETNR